MRSMIVDRVYVEYEESSIVYVVVWDDGEESVVGDLKLLAQVLAENAQRWAKV